MRKIAKRIARLLFKLLTAPLYLLYVLLAALLPRDQVFAAFSQVLALVPGKIGVYARAAFYALSCEGTSDEISVGFLTLLSHADTHIDEGVYIGPQSNIGKCRIGRNCLLGSGVHILSGSQQHSFSDPKVPIREQEGVYVQITIGEDCWIGNNAVVMANLGKHCVVAAGSVVTKPVADNLIVAGNPARQISRRQ